MKVVCHVVFMMFMSMVVIACGGSSGESLVGQDSDSASQKPSFDAPQEQFFTVGVSITSLSLQNDENSEAIESCTAVLPDGLSISLNNDACIISGIPTSAVSGLFYVSASNTYGDVTVSFRITVEMAEVAATPPSLTMPGPQFYTLGEAISPVILLNGAGAGDIQSCTATLPEGLSVTLSKGACVISGTPSLVASGTYQVAAFNVGGSSVASMAITVINADVINVADEAQLQTTIAQLADNTIIVLAAGTYRLTNTLVIRENNITLRGSTGNRDDVVLLGPGMENANYGAVQHGIWTDADYLTVADLSIGEIWSHPIALQSTADSPRISNVRLFNAGEQFIKASSGGWGIGSDDGIVENSLFEYTDAPPVIDHGGGSGYFNGIDVHGGKNWIIRNNRFDNLTNPDTAAYLFAPTILMWNGAGNTLIENNIFWNSDRAIALGLIDRTPYDHEGGMVRNNYIYMDVNHFSEQRRNSSDASILVWDSDNTKVLHNTVITNGNIRYAIEYRFSSQNSEARNNLADAPIGTRDGGSYNESNNVVDATLSLFEDPSYGDLSLANDAQVAQAPLLSDVTLDIDGQQRQGLVDVGADELLADDVVVNPPLSNMPVANAGPDQNTTDADNSGSELIRLDGSSSTDNGSIVAYDWQVDGVSIATGINPDVSLTVGTHLITLVVMDDEGNTNTDTVSVSVFSQLSEDLFQIDQMTYQGAFRLNSGNYGGDSSNYSVNYSVGPLAYNPKNHSLFVVGHAQGSRIAEFPIPTPEMKTSVNELANPEPPLQNFVYLFDTVNNPDGINRVTGMLWYNNALIVNAETWYDADGGNTDTTLVVENADNLTGSVKGYFHLNGAANSAGYMGFIPADVQSLFGGAQYFSGWSSVYSIVSRYSFGPSLWTFHPDDLINGDASQGPQISSTAYMNFRFSSNLREEIQSYDMGPGGSRLWNMLTKGRFGFFVPGTKTFAVLGSSAGIDSGIGYKITQTNGNLCGGYCAYDPDDQYNYYWLYNIDDIIGAEEVSEPRPYSYGKISLPFDDNGRYRVIGGTVDTATNTLYISLYGAGRVGRYDTPPLILTYSLDRPQ